MAWTTAVDDLRYMLSDGPTDKLRYRKRVIGKIDGANITFKTFEFRRLTDLTTATAPVGVYKNGSIVAVSSDSPALGEFVLAAAPVDGDVLEASYYIQWFLDTELQSFLKYASQWLSVGEDYTLVAIGVRQAALEYAACQAYRKLAIKWAEALSEVYQLEDAPREEHFKVIDSYKGLADQFCARAEGLRNDYYSRQGQSNAPLFGISKGNVRDVPPGR